MCEYFSLFQSDTCETGTFKTFSTYATKHAYKYGFFCYEKKDDFATLCAFNDAEDIDTVFGDRYSDLIATEVGQCFVTDENRWLRIW